MTERLLAAAGADLTVAPHVEFFWDEDPDGRVFFVPDRLLVDVWRQLTLSDSIRDAWAPLMAAAIGRRDTIGTIAPASEDE